MGFRCTTCLESDDSLRNDKALQKKVYCAYQHENRLNGYRTTVMNGDSEIDDYDRNLDDDSSLSDDTASESEGNDNDGNASSDNTTQSGATSRSGNYSGLPVPFYKKHKKYNYHGKPLIYVCSRCMTHVALSSFIVSDCYRGKMGNALLVYKIVNVITGRIESHEMTTGAYYVSNLICKQCGTYLGWQYVKSASCEQKYKEGLYILEACSVKQLLPS